MNDLAGRLHAYRQAQQLTARELAKRAGVSVSYIYAIEAGDRGRNLFKLQRIADALGIPVSALWENGQSS